MSLVDQKFSQYLSTLDDQAAAGFLRELVFALPEDQRREMIIKHCPEFKMTQNMTAEEIEQHIKDHPMVGFDICSKCDGTQPQNSMSSLNDSINCTALICDECAESEDTVYNRCKECNFDMGESYENCGGADDGTCPECGTEQEDLPEEVKECVAQGTHLKDCDDDGFCNSCGHQESPEEEEVFDEEQQWNVPVCRIGYSHTLMAVSARSESEAIQKALDEAGGEEFSESSSEYEAPDGAHLIKD